MLCRSVIYHDWAYISLYLTNPSLLTFHPVFQPKHSCH
uniref:Uncharacterized protein n=1 Tax=Anguilla anguilla TaxID=7936 RepID=A0A0E9QZ62_ANGAN